MRYRYLGTYKYSYTLIAIHTSVSNVNNYHLDIQLQFSRNN